MDIDKIHQLFLSCKAVSTDTRTISNNDLFFALKGDHFNGNTYAKKAIELGAKYAIIDELEYEIPNKTILVDNTLETLQKLATYHRFYLNKPIIALTGSNGKTTTKELINAVLSKKFKTTATIGNLNNHIGVPLTLLSMNDETEIGIVEMGANHQKEIEFLCQIAQPDYGYITNFGKAHLEGFGGTEGVIKGKSEMYDYLINNDKTVFINYNDPIQVKKNKYTKHKYSFGTNPDKTNVIIGFKSAQPYVSCTYNAIDIQTHLIGEYNFNNIAIAITIGHYFQVEDTKIKAAIENYIPSNNRSQIIKKGDYKIILDAYNANPSSMEAALRNFDIQNGKKIAILGDMFELGDDAKKEHQQIVDLANSLNIDELIFIGENFFNTTCSSSKILRFNSFETFIEGLNLNSLKNTTLLIKGSRGMALERVLEYIK
ncbi:UDP-N-acetylmuramoyl-tripeptide--D-alanyl-D-alanine ligase [Cognatitamlana onchidii]|uniref:UDP-N-acetylmuramoyl-tripeptide--D-alanyl-D- alanine ligase n=1 Tax=Cognatitamlana onchidii TaxID=2562860 RepID=UPI0010A5DFD1|nr:UDP-N-acetylmuramoyl-tripeptide--D-alanyl-D-alanine ligase [Algibacter onchidii]